MNRLFLFALMLILFASCGDDEITPESRLKEFIVAVNNQNSISDFHSSTKKTEKGYVLTRKYAEKLNPEKITCKTEEEEAICECETESGKKRKFHLIYKKQGWQIDLGHPEIILEIFHIMYSQGMLDEILPFATNSEAERLEVFKGMVEGMGIPENERLIVPFGIRCKEFKKKYECHCISDEGEAGYYLFKTSQGWKAELGELKSFDNDSIIDYNSNDDFNLNQENLDSLTNFSQKMLDSMLNL